MHIWFQVFLHRSEKLTWKLLWEIFCPSKKHFRKRTLKKEKCPYLNGLQRGGPKQQFLFVIYLHSEMWTKPNDSIPTALISWTENWWMMATMKELLNIVFPWLSVSSRIWPSFPFQRSSTKHSKKVRKSFLKNEGRTRLILSYDSFRFFFFTVCFDGFHTMAVGVAKPAYMLF